MKTVLIVTYMFPPLSGVGSIRPLKFARYLPDFGWRPLVLTVRGGFDWSSGMDPTLLDQLPPEVRIYRARSIEPPYRAIAGMSGQAAPRRASWPKRILQGLRTALLVPDEKVGWLPFALAQGRRILREEKVDLVFSTSPPPTVHLVARVLSRWAHCPLFVDLRDPWTQHQLHPWLRNPLRRRVEEAMEHGVVRQARRVITVSPTMSAGLADKYPDVPRERFVTLTNGFDQADFGPPAPPPHNDRFTAVYTGSLYYRWQADPFLAGLERLVHNHPDLRPSLHVIMAGKATQDLAGQLADRDLEGVVTLLGPVPYRQAVALQQQADLLLVLLWDSPGFVGCYTSKVFEYLATGRPILALAPEGVIAELIREAGTGVPIPPNSPEAVEAALLDLYARWREGRMPALVDPNFPNRFERRALTEQLAGLMDEAVAESPGRKR